MAAITFTCPHCKERFQAPPETVGKIVACPSCQTKMTVPVPGRAHATAANPAGAAPTAPRQRPTAAASATAEDEKGGHLVRNVGIGAGVVAVALVAVLVVPELTRDRWDLHNAERVSAKLAEADRVQQADPLAAYETYDEVLKEARQHKIGDAELARKLASAEQSRGTLYQKVQDKIRAEEAGKQRRVEEEARLAAAEKQRRVEEEARRAAAEKQRIAAEAEQKRAATEAQGLAEEKQRAEEKRQKEALAVYRNPPQSARNALNAVKKVQARTEVGVNLNNWSTIVGEAWGEVKVFAESPEGIELPELSFLLTSAMGKYKLALDAWQGELHPVAWNKPASEVLSEVLLHKCWRAAERRLELAQALVNENGAAMVLPRVATLHRDDGTYEARIRELFPDRATDAVDVKYRELSGQVSPGGPLLDAMSEFTDKLLKERANKLGDLKDPAAKGSQ